MNLKSIGLWIGAVAGTIPILVAVDSVVVTSWELEASEAQTQTLIQKVVALQKSAEDNRKKDRLDSLDQEIFDLNETINFGDISEAEKTSKELRLHQLQIKRQNILEDIE